MKKIYAIFSVLIILISLVLFTSTKTNREINRKEEKEEAGFDYFFAQRSYPYGKMDYKAYQSAARSFKAQSAQARSAFVMNWQYAGPNNIGGRIVDIEMDPTNQQVAYLGAASGGVFKTADGGTSWIPVFDDQTSLSIGDIAIAPSNTNIIYVGTGEANGGSGSLTYDANGVYKSIDGGLTWAQSGLQLTRITGRMAVHPTNPDIAFAATMGDLYGNTPDRGLYRTADGGLSWTKVLFLNDSTGCIDVVINPQNPDYVFAATWERSRQPNNKRYYGESSGLWRSTDGGLTWSQLTVGLPAIGGLYSRIGIDLCTSNPSVLYCMYTDQNYDFLGIFKSTDNGSTWSQVNDGDLIGTITGQGYWYGRVKVDPADENNVYVIGFDMYKTTDGGNSFSPTFNGIHVDQHAIAVHPLNHNFVMNGCDGGLNISNDGGDTWIHHEDLPITQFYTCSMDYQDPASLYGGTQDNNCIRTLTGSFYDWNATVGGDGFYTFCDPVDNSYVYAESQYGNMFRSDDGGNNFNFLSNGLSGASNWNSPWIFDPQNSQTLFMGTQQVFRSDDRGDNWFSISPDLTTIDVTGSLLFGTITALDASPLNSDVIYAGTDDGKVWRTLNGGGGWLDVTGTLPVRWVTRLTCDPFNVNRAYLTLSGYRYHDNMVHVYMTSDNGATWQGIAGNLPDVPCNDVIPDPNVDSLLYLATDAGVYFTSDMGANWAPVGTGMPTLVCTDLYLHNPTHTLLAATYGRGMYKIDLSEALGTSAPEITLNSLHVYPVPAKDVVNVKINSDKNLNAEIKIYDIKGNLMTVLLNGELKKGATVFKWNVQDKKISSGIYFVSAAINGKRNLKKIVVSD